MNNQQSNGGKREKEKKRKTHLSSLGLPTRNKHNYPGRGISGEKTPPSDYLQESL